MHKLHVIPPQRLIVILLQLRMKTHLSQVLHDNVLAFNERVYCAIGIRRTVLAVSKALVHLERLLACWASPCDKARLESHIAAQIVSVFVEFFDEVEGQNVV